MRFWFQQVNLDDPCPNRGSSLCLACLYRIAIGYSMLVPRGIANYSNLFMALVRISSCVNGVLDCSKYIVI